MPLKRTNPSPVLRGFHIAGLWKGLRARQVPSHRTVAEEVGQEAEGTVTMVGLLLVKLKL